MNERRPHSDQQYEAALGALHAEIRQMGALVAEQIANAVNALMEGDDDAARAVIENDRTINRMDVTVDEMCLRLLALHQPTAHDLRLITTALKITTDLERVGDMAEHISERTLELRKEPGLEPPAELPRMAEIALAMLSDSLEAFVREDAELALAVCGRDDEMDALMDKSFHDLVALMAKDPSRLGRAIRLTFVAKSLERVADHATNVAEMVVFMVTGKSIRHSHKIQP